MTYERLDTTRIIEVLNVVGNARGVYIVGSMLAKYFAGWLLTMTRRGRDLLLGPEQYVKLLTKLYGK